MNGPEHPGLPRDDEAEPTPEQAEAAAQDGEDEEEPAPRLANNPDAKLPPRAYLRMTFYNDGDTRFEYDERQARLDVNGMKLCAGNATLAIWQVLKWVDKQIRKRQEAAGVIEYLLNRALEHPDDGEQGN